MTDPDDEIPTQSYWPSVTDLFLTLFIIAIAIVAVVFYTLLPTNNVGKDRVVHAVGNDLLHVREPMNRLRQALELDPVGASARPTRVIAALSETCDAAVTQIELLRSQLKPLQERLLEYRREREEQRTQIEDFRRQLHDKPPIIQISEQKEQYRFESGSSVMSPAFVEGLNQNELARLADEIIARQQEGRVKVDTLEIIGHTDGVPLARVGNLDQKLPELLVGARPTFASLSPGSNNDLGLLRALAVREQWERYVDTREHHRDVLRKIRIRCYSAGQTILPYARELPSAEDFRQPDPRARRIEMRLTRLGS